MTIVKFPIGAAILKQSIDAATTRDSEMVTIVIEDDSMTVRKFELADIGDEDAQYEWLHEELCRDAPVRPFKDWAHLETAGKNRYPKGTGWGWWSMAAILRRCGVDQPHPILQRMLAEGRIVDLGIFNSSVGSPFRQYAAVPLKDNNEDNS